MNNIEETKNYFIEEINRNGLINKKHKNISTTLNCIEHLLILHFYFSFSLLGVFNKLNNTEVFFSRALIDSYISHDEFVLVKNVLKEYDETKEEIKSPNKR